MASTFGSVKRSISASMPIWRKNTGTRRWLTGAISRRMRSAGAVRASASPATNAPTIGASLACSASTATARVKASVMATRVPADRL